MHDISDFSLTFYTSSNYTLKLLNKVRVKIIYFDCCIPAKPEYDECRFVNDRMRCESFSDVGAKAIDKIPFCHTNTAVIANFSSVFYALLIKLKRPTFMK